MPASSANIVHSLRIKSSDVGDVNFDQNFIICNGKNFKVGVKNVSFNGKSFFLL